MYPRNPQRSPANLLRPIGILRPGLHGPSELKATVNCMFDSARRTNVVRVIKKCVCLQRRDAECFNYKHVIMSQLQYYSLNPESNTNISYRKVNK